jgi:hypothetical protein
MGDLAMISSNLLRMGVFCMTVAAIACFARATPLPITNPSFEDPAQADGVQQEYAFIPGWVPFNALAGLENPSSSRFAQTNDIINDSHADGHQYAEGSMLPGQVTGWGTDSLPYTILPNTLYTITVAAGHALDVPPTDYRVSLLGNGTGFAQLDVDGTTIPAGTFQDLTLTYTSPATGTAIGRNMAILIRFTNNRSVFAEGEVDNVRFDAAPAPEPGSLCLMGLGCLALLRRSRR